jgi:hypothetical protein
MHGCVWRSDPGDRQEAAFHRGRAKRSDEGHEPHRTGLLQLGAITLLWFLILPISQLDVLAR